MRDVPVAEKDRNVDVTIVELMQDIFKRGRAFMLGE